MSIAAPFFFVYMGGLLALCFSLGFGTVQTATALAVSVLLATIVENTLLGWAQSVTVLGILILGYSRLPPDPRLTPDQASWPNVPSFPMPVGPSLKRSRSL